MSEIELKKFVFTGLRFEDGYDSSFGIDCFCPSCKFYNIIGFADCLDSEIKYENSKLICTKFESAK